MSNKRLAVFSPLVLIAVVIAGLFVARLAANPADQSGILPGEVLIEGHDEAESPTYEVEQVLSGVRALNGQTETVWRIERVVRRPWEESEPSGLRGEEGAPITVVQADDGQMAEISMSTDGRYVRQLHMDAATARVATGPVSSTDARRIAESVIELLLPGDASELKAVTSRTPTGFSWHSFVYRRFIGNVPTSDGCTIRIDKNTGSVIGWSAGWDTVPQSEPPALTPGEALAVFAKTTAGQTEGLTPVLEYTVYIDWDPALDAGVRRACLAYSMQDGDGQSHGYIDANTGSLCE